MIDIQSASQIIILVWGIGYPVGSLLRQFKASREARRQLDDSIRIEQLRQQMMPQTALKQPSKASSKGFKLLSKEPELSYLEQLNNIVNNDNLSTQQRITEIKKLNMKR